MKKIIIILLLLLPLIAEQKRVAVLDFTGKGISVMDASSVADFFRTDLVNLNQFMVLDRGNMERILNEQEFQSSGCTDTACAVEMGKLLNMQFMFTGTVSKFGEKYVVSISMINVETGQIVSSKRETVDEFSMMIDTTSRIANSFAEQISEKEDPRSKKKKKAKKLKPSSGSSWSTLKLMTFVGGSASIVLGGTMNVLGFLGQGAADKFYDEIYMTEAATDQAVADKYNEYEGKLNLANIEMITGYCLYGVGTGLLVWWFLIPSDKSISYIPELIPVIGNNNYGYKFKLTYTF